MSHGATPEQKLRAYRLTRAAIKRGELIRPDACTKCGATPKTSDGRSAIQAHHPDYSKPTDVEWICAKCHRAETPLPKVMGAPTPGERNGAAKLTAESVVFARRLRLTGLSYMSIAVRLGVDKRAAMRAVKGEQWGHVRPLIEEMMGEQHGQQ